MTSNERLAGMCEGRDKPQKEIRRGGRENVQDSLDSTSGPRTAIRTCEKCTHGRSSGMQHVLPYKDFEETLKLNPVMTKQDAFSYLLKFSIGLPSHGEPF